MLKSFQNEPTFRRKTCICIFYFSGNVLFVQVKMEMTFCLSSKQLPIAEHLETRNEKKKQASFEDLFAR